MGPLKMQRRWERCPKVSVLFDCWTYVLGFSVSNTVLKKQNQLCVMLLFHLTLVQMSLGVSMVLCFECGAVT